LSKNRTIEIKCRSCETKSFFECWDTINATLDPELKKQLFDGKINIYQCTNCGAKTFIDVPILYNDMGNHFMVQFYPFYMTKQAEFLKDFDEHGRLSFNWGNTPDSILEQMRNTHVVFSIEELLQYIVFRDMLALYKKSKERVMVMGYQKIIQAANDYPSGKYSENFYNHHLKVIELAIRVDESVIRAVKYLFLWKLGKVSTTKTPKSYVLDFIDLDGTRYYATNTTEANNRAINKAIDIRNLEAAYRFRDEFEVPEKFYSVAHSITSSSLVLPVFFMHIWCPAECPIIDINVWKAFCNYDISGKKRGAKPNSWPDYMDYMAFFQEVVQITGSDWRTVDKGLWVIGSRLTKGPNPPPPPIAVPPSIIPIPQHILDYVLKELRKLKGEIPFRVRGIKITIELIKATMEILNAEPSKTLPQNCLNGSVEKTPDGLDRRIKEYLGTDLRTANIISDVLAEVGIVDVIQVVNPPTGRSVKGTRLRSEWTW
jgi:hypothetical protein